jgi:hypothetical protein
MVTTHATNEPQWSPLLVSGATLFDGLIAPAGS